MIQVRDAISETKKYFAEVRKGMVAATLVARRVHNRSKQNPSLEQLSRDAQDNLDILCRDFDFSLLPISLPLRVAGFYLAIACHPITFIKCRISQPHYNHNKI